MGNPKGGIFERDTLKYLRELGHDVERLRLAGREDEGDILLRLRERRFVLELKNRKGLDLAGWTEEAYVEAINYSSHREIDPAHYAVVHKRKGKGTHMAYVTLPLYEYLEQING